MSLGLTTLHSHSGLEREIRMEKRFVLIDTMFANLFLRNELVPFVYNKKKYYKVPIMSFVKNGGTFKNLNQ